LRGRVEGFEVERETDGCHGDEVFGRGVEVEELLKRVTESEVGREKLGSEVQILRLKLKRLGESSSDFNLVKSPSCSSNVTSPTSDVVNMLGRVTTSCNDDDLLIPLLRSRIDELIRLLQLSDSKALHYYSEAVNLCRLVRSGQVNYKRIESEFGKLKGRFRGVCDELEDTKSVYERQVDSLTEHVGMLNEKLSIVVEEVSVLKGQQQR